MAAVYESGSVGVPPSGNVQISFPSRVYDVPSNPYVFDPGGDWRFVAPFYTAYLVQLRGELTAGFLYFAYSVNGGQYTLYQNSALGFNATDVVVMDVGDLLRFRAVDISGLGGIVVGLHCCVAQIGH